VCRRRRRHAALAIVVRNEFFAEIFDRGGGGSLARSFFARGFEIFCWPTSPDHGE